MSPQAVGRVRLPRVGWLDAAVVVVALLTAVLVVGSPTRPGGLGLLGAALAAFVATWFTVGREAARTGRRWLPVVVILVLACATGTAASPAFATFQLIAFPVVWFVTPGVVSGIVASAGITVAIGVPYAVGTSVLEALFTEGVSLAFSIAMGVWISSIEQRSRERQDLVDELTAAQARIAALNRQSGIVEERERLARELHDTLTQSLTGIVMLAERAGARHPEDPALTVLEDAARQAMAEARALVTAGANVPLDGGLAGALGTLADRFRRETGLDVTVDVSAEVPRGLEVVLMRCAQEGLANVRKHAGASAVLVRVVEDGGFASLTVTDDGSGPGTGAGYGIPGMRDRLALVDGDVDLAAAPGGGAVLAVRVPMAATP